MDKLKGLVTQWEGVARRKFSDAAVESDPMGKRLIEHGAVCYWNCAQQLRTLERTLFAAMIANITTRITVMRESFFEVPYLLLQLAFIELKTFILTLKVRYLLLKRDNLLFDKRMLIVKKRNSLLQYRGRAMLVNKFFNTVEKTHSDTSNSSATWLSKKWPSVGSAGVGAPFEQMRVYVEIIPREVADVMSEPFKSIANRCGPINDSLGYETLHDAIINAEAIGASLLGEVEPENLLFIFGQTIQSLGYAPIELPLSPPCFGESESIGSDGHNKEGNGNNEGKPKHRAAVLCKLKYADSLEKLIARKKQESGHGADRYEITWCELQELKRRLGDIGDHVKPPSTK